MNKLVSLTGIAFMLIIGAFYCVANEQVIVTAIVGNINHSPVITSLNPSDSPRLLRRDKIQKYTLKFTDDEKDNINYTITPQDGYSYPVSGLITDYDSSNSAYINFTYLAPSTVPAGGLSKITVTLNDGSNIVTKDINLYIY